MKISSSLKVGILTLLSLIIVIVGIMWLRGRSISAGERIDVRFQDVDGMRPGSAVQMMGIRIGQVEEVIPVINPNASFVKVKFVITEPGINIPQASTISIQQSGIIGEKFLEITPPQAQTMLLPAERNINTDINNKMPVDIFINNKSKVIGKVKNIKILSTDDLPQTQRDKFKTTYVYKIDYTITIPGIIIPDDAQASLISYRTDKSLYKLHFILPDNILSNIYVVDNKYTIIEPTRLKKFFDVQLKSAAALEKTNERINSLLSDETLNDLKATLKNTKILTAKASFTLDQANELINTSNKELNNLVSMATDLSNNMIVLSNNVNNIIGDPQLKTNLLSVTDSIQKSAKNISNIVEDKKTAETLSLVNNSAKDLSEITSYVNNLTKNDDLKLDKVITNLNGSLLKLSNILDGVNNMTPEDEKKLKDIVKDSSDISKNLKQFSDKLNKRFLLFRLLF